jgi:hypothetical protein
VLAGPVEPRLVPLGNLQRQQDAQHQHHEVDANGGSVLLADVRDESAQSYGHASAWPCVEAGEPLNKSPYRWSD